MNKGGKKGRWPREIAQSHTGMGERERDKGKEGRKDEARGERERGKEKRACDSIASGTFICRL